MKKKIAIWMPGGVGGGYYSQGIPVISKLIDDLSSDFQISIYTLYPTNDDFQPNGYKIFSINKKIKINWLRWSLLTFLFLKHHCQKKYNLLYAFWGFPTGFLVVVLSKILKRPSVIHLQGGDAIYIPSINYGSLKGFNKKLMIWAYNHCSTLIALTNFQKDKLITIGVTIPIEVIPFGPDQNLFKFKENFVFHHPVRFLHVGNLLPVKDQITLLNSFALIANKISCEIRIIGEDHLKGSVQRHCEKLNLQDKTEFNGIQPYDKMPFHYAWADILLVTSVYEGQCLAVSEAAASGVMIAGTRTGIVSDWGDRCVVIAEVGGVEQLARNILNVIERPEVIAALIMNANSEILFKNRTWTFKKIGEQINRLTPIS